MTAQEKFMKQALKQAQKAALLDEVPVGAVIVQDGKIIARAFNKRRTPADATGHAEIAVIKKACKKTGDFRLTSCDLYVTLEPCPMCAGACVNARVENIYFGAYDEKAGCCGTLYNLPQDVRFNHRAAVTGGVLQEECAKLLSDFFKVKRKDKKQKEDF